MRLFRMITGLLALFPRRPVPGSGDLQAENASLRRMADELRAGNLKLVRELREAAALRTEQTTPGASVHWRQRPAEVREGRARENLDRIRELLRRRGVNVARSRAPQAVEQCLVELALLREKVGSGILREEGLESCGTPGRDCGWESR